MRGLRSIASRLSLWSLLGSLVVIVACSLVLLGHLREQWLLSAHREGGTLAAATAAAAAAANGIEAHIERVTEATRLRARLAESRSDRTEELARTTLSANADLPGLSFAWIPDDPVSPPPAPFVDRLPDGTLGQRDLAAMQRATGNSPGSCTAWPVTRAAGSSRSFRNRANDA